MSWGTGTDFSCGGGLGWGASDTVSQKDKRHEPNLSRRIHVPAPARPQRRPDHFLPLTPAPHKAHPRLLYSFSHLDLCLEHSRPLRQLGTDGGLGAAAGGDGALAGGGEQAVVAHAGCGVGAADLRLKLTVLVVPILWVCVCVGGGGE